MQTYEIQEATVTEKLASIAATGTQRWEWACASRTSEVC